MKILSLIFLVTFFCITKLHAQTKFKNEEDIKKYILENLDGYDNIVGIYSLSAYENRYFKGERIKKALIGEIGKIAIVRQGSCFAVYHIYAGLFSHEPCTIEATAIPNTYLWSPNKESTISPKASFNSEGILVRHDKRSIQEAAKVMNRPINEVLKVGFEIILTEEYTKLFPTQWDIQSSNKKSGKSVSSTGTGFAISSDGYIVTNYHVVEGSKDIKIRGINNDFSVSYKAKVSVSDKNNDLAILKIDDEKFKTIGLIPYVVNTKSIDVGESVFVLGYPLTATMGEEIKLTNGIISSKSGFNGDINAYQISAPVQPGNSGGPLFDKNGNLVGIVNARHIEAQNASYAIKSNYLFNLIDMLPSKIKLQSVSSLEGLTLPNQVKKSQPFVYLIEVN